MDISNVGRQDTHNVPYHTYLTLLWTAWVPWTGHVYALGFICQQDAQVDGGDDMA